MPIDPRRAEEFDPLAVPTVTALLSEIDQWKKPDEELVKPVQDWEKTSLKPYIDLFRTFVAGLVRDEVDVKIKRERGDVAAGPQAMEF